VRPRDTRHGPRTGHDGRHPGTRTVRDQERRAHRHRARRRLDHPGLPDAPLTPVEVPRGVAEALGAEPLSAHDTGLSVGDLLVELADEKTVLGLSPDLASLARHSERGIIATARAGDPSEGYDFVSRCFFPNIGIDEDPVTGSAHTALAPFWSERLGRTDLTGRQASSRSGLVRTELRGDRTLLTGRAVTVIEGELLA
jgi:PhzF family phenazine biosynthesis protein